MPQVLQVRDDLDYGDTVTELRLLQQAKAGQDHALGQLMHMHARLITRLTSKFTHPLIPFEELESGAHEGFVRAVHGYDPSKGKFSTYAWECVQDGIRKVRRKELRYRNRHRSLTSQRDDEQHDQEVEFHPAVPLDYHLHQEEYRQRLTQLLQCLQPHEQQLLAERYGLAGTEALSEPELAWHYATGVATIQGRLRKILCKLRTSAKTTPSPQA